jgi:trans-aconitate 2-methyltransferase
MVSAWSPADYLAFEAERTRPARDLLSAVPPVPANYVVDLGCGPGNSTELLTRRFPDARIVGVDSSAEMVVAATARVPQASFVRADIATWTPPAPVDLFFANAVFQWVPDHLTVLARLMDMLTPGGVLAVQMPDNFAEPSHALMDRAAEDGPWRRKLAGAEDEREPIPDPASYYDRLTPMATRVDVWRTVYHHPLAGPEAIVPWFKATGLRPYLNRLDASAQEDYLAAYQELISAAYPRQADGGVLLAFPRLFIVAVRR